METPSLISERMWLQKGVEGGEIRQRTAEEILKLLDRIPTEWNDLTVYPTIQTKPHGSVDS